MTTIIRRVVGAILRRFGYDIARQRDIQASISKLEKEDLFRDSFGNEFERLRGYRDLVKPEWRTMFQPPPDIASIKLNVDGALKQVREMNEFLNKFGFDVAGKDVLEVGCHDGRAAFALASLKAGHVDAIDIPVYGVLSEEAGEPDLQSLANQSMRLQELRTRCAKSFLDVTVSDRVDFFDLDVIDLSKEDAYDLIVSWETLEHIVDPGKAMRIMFRALRPGGFCFHEYNPFYSLEGGHSLCTLDFPYGHARLSSDDFERYVKTYRPEELGVAMNFYNHCLNRMTISDLRRHCTDAGFEMLGLFTWLEKGDLAAIDQNTIMQCKTHKANVTINDLLSSRIWILLRKPGK
jgi:2-polyprenyl-3-methyl-5-hydroxy-6-metoxy-1,4-benzoquinol methylase